VRMFDAGKTRMIRLPYGEKNGDDMFSRFHLILKRHGRTDRRTDRIAISISCVSMLTRDKNRKIGNNLLKFTIQSAQQLSTVILLNLIGEKKTI